MKYTIQTKQKNYLSGLVHNSINEVMEAIVFYDLLPPFNVLDESKNDVTNEVISKITKLGYKFIDKKKVATNIPSELQELMNKCYRNTVMIKENVNLSVKLTTVKDIKSIPGFYELWENKAISIGKSGDDILILDLNDYSISLIEKNNTRNLSNKRILYKTSMDFVIAVKNNIVSY